ncbi:MAG: ATP-binding protein [Bacteroidetes bacterium]|nr:ATP-binding protein [Bacteroidota bacterium]MBX7044285.1 ATP-binding protein [Ignavibacteria bacterium]
MYLVELYELIEKGEGLNTEFKRKFTTPEKIAKEITAFANTSGGVILFGVDDDKTIYGIESEKEEMELISTAAKFYCEPEVLFDSEILYIKNKDVVVITIPESKSKPHRIVSEDENENGKVYVRFNDKSIIASKEAEKILRSSSETSAPLKLYIGDIEKALFAYLEANQKITVKGFKRLVNISERRASRTLINLVRAQVIRHHFLDNEEFFTLA